MSSMVDSDLPSKLLSILSKAADIVCGHNFIQVYSHYDADGITAASIVGKALHRAGKEYRITIFPTLIDEFMQIIESTPSECVIVTDLGASYIDRFEKMTCDVIVLDHHTLRGDSEKVCYANPHMFGVDGMTSGCGATMAFLFAIAMDERNWDLAPLAMAGIAGDRQHLNGMSGFNTFVFEGAVDRGLVKPMSGSLIPVGRLYDELLISTDPYIRGVSGNREGISRLLKDAGIPEDRDYVDLTEEESIRLSSLIAIRLIQQGVSREKLEELARTKYYLPGWNTDAESLSSFLNSCGRQNMPSVGIGAGMGDPDCLKQAKELDNTSRKQLMEGIKVLDNGESIIQMENIQWFDSSSTGFTGMLCGTVMSYIGDPDKPTIGINASDENANVSSRGTFSQLAKGIDLAEAMKEGCASVGGEGGGHKIAAGGSFKSEKRDEFLKNVDAIVGRQKQGKSAS